MANIHLVTGYGGNAHITAADHGSFNAAIFGDGQYVLDRGKQLAATVISNNKIQIADGDILMQGRHIRLAKNSSVDLTIENGASGYKRNDLIVCRYTRNTTSGVEECNLVVIKGTATTGTAIDPAYTDGNIMNGDTQVDFPLYRIPISGLTVGTPERLFAVVSPHGTQGSSMVSSNLTLTANENGKVIAVSDSSTVYITAPDTFDGMEVTIFRMGSGRVGVSPGAGAYFMIPGHTTGAVASSGLVCYIPETFGCITLRNIGSGMWIIQGDVSEEYEGG